MKIDERVGDEGDAEALVDGDRQEIGCRELSVGIHALFVL